MAKRRKKKNSKCPEPFNTLINLAAGATMNAIANKMEEKHHYRKRGVPNPYRASAFGLASGRLNKMEDIIRLGGLMGAMGAFDSDETDCIDCPPSSYNSKMRRIDKSTSNSFDVDSLNSAVVKKNNNKYAWRLNCEDGSQYGVYPEDYESREAYNNALLVKRQCNTQEVLQESRVKDFEEKTEKVCNSSLFVCMVSRLDNGINKNYYTYNDKLKVGDTVSVLSESGNTVQGVVISIAKYKELLLETNLNDFPFILE